MILTALIADASLFIAGTVLGALLLLVGLAIGLWAGRRSVSQTSPDPDQTVRLVGGLFQWANDVVGDVAQHREIMSQLAQQVDCVKPSDDQSDAVQLLSEIVQANEQLQHRLDDAETTLKNQAVEVSAYLSEARTDSLTGLANRRAFDNELEKNAATCQRQDAPISVVMIDVDQFKTLNDRFGHLAGDQILVDIAPVLQTIFDTDGFVARFGGDEFAVILPSTETDDAVQLTELARQNVEELELVYDDSDVGATVSCGVAQARANEPLGDLLKRSDEALYAAKENGRNTVCLHDGLQLVKSTGVAGDKSTDRSPVTPNLSAACNDLRRRLLEVTEGSDN